MRLSATLDRSPPPAPADPSVRPPHVCDRLSLAHLMLDAYRGTIDDHGEGLPDAIAGIDRWLSGAYGEAVLSASNITPRGESIASATLVSLENGIPFIAFSMTAPRWKRQGLARTGILLAMSSLRDAGHRTVRLVVTDGNHPAIGLYTRLGFKNA